MDLPLSLLEMGCSGRFELITHPVAGQPLLPQSTVSMAQAIPYFPIYRTHNLYLNRVVCTFCTIPPHLHISGEDSFLSQNISKSKLHLGVFEINDVVLPPQLPHGLPPTSLSLETEVEKLFLQDPSWLPIHDTDFAFQKFPKYIFFINNSRMN